MTAVCRGKNRDLVTSIGADHVIDYTQGDFTQNGQRYDVIYDAVMKAKASACRRVLKQQGTFVNNSGLPKMTMEDILFIKDLVAANQLEPILNREYSLDEVVEAHRYVERGHKKGNVVLSVWKD